MALPQVGGGYQVGDGNTNEVQMKVQIGPTAKTTSVTLTVAEVTGGLITVNQGASTTSTLTTPTGAALDAALTTFKVDTAFDFHIINTSTNSNEPAVLAAGTGVTLVGNDDIVANSATNVPSSAHFRARRTAAEAWSIYRLS